MTAYRGALLAAVLAESERRQQAVVSVKPYDPDLDLYDLQRVRVGDPSRFKAWPAGRRSGKTNAAEKLLLKVATSTARVQAYYVSTSIKRAVATIWDELVEINRARDLGGVANYGVHTLTFANGSKVVVTGVESKAMANDLRGRPRVALWFLDECQDWPDELLRYFYENVVYPSLIDVKGSVVCAGTGGAPRGFWFEVATAADGFTRFPAWNPLQNIHLPQGEARKIIDKACKDRGVDESAPSIRREFFAEFCTESAHQIFPYVAERNGFDRGEWDHRSKLWTGLPAGKWSFLIGADFGTVDAVAVAVWAYTDASPFLYLVEAQADKGLGSSGQAAFVKAFIERYTPGLVGCYGDPGGGGKGIIVDLRQEHGLYVVGAEKMGKPAACVSLRDGLRTGKVKVAIQEVEMVRELGIPEWDPSAIGDVIRGHFPDQVDAALYGHRQVAKLHRYVPPPPVLTEQEAAIEKIRLGIERDEAWRRRIGA